MFRFRWLTYVSIAVGYLYGSQLFLVVVLVGICIVHVGVVCVGVGHAGLFHAVIGCVGLGKWVFSRGVQKYPSGWYFPINLCYGS